MEYHQSTITKDNRGQFTKLFTNEWSALPSVDISEIFTSFSHQGVVRGLHVQIGSAANWRIVSILNGIAFDIVMDLREGSKTFGQIQSQILKPTGITTVVIPPGVAHGFQALEDSNLIYFMSSNYDPLQDTGVNIAGLDINWPLPIGEQSPRDKKLPSVTQWIGH